MSNSDQNGQEKYAYACIRQVSFKLLQQHSNLYWYTCHNKPSSRCVSRHEERLKPNSCWDKRFQPPRWLALSITTLHEHSYYFMSFIIPSSLPGNSVDVKWPQAYHQEFCMSCSAWNWAPKDNTDIIWFQNWWTSTRRFTSDGQVLIIGSTKQPRGLNILLGNRRMIEMGQKENHEQPLTGK